MTGSYGLDLFTAHDSSDGRYKKEKKGLESFFVCLKNHVDLLKLLVATAYVGCMASAPCKRLCVEYTTFACKQLIRTYTTCALEATCAYDVRLMCVSNLLRTYSTTFARKRLMRSKRLVRTKYDCCA